MNSPVLSAIYSCMSLGSGRDDAGGVGGKPVNLELLWATFGNLLGEDSLAEPSDSLLTPR